jgi:2-alkyl-3-oxoalkanoate reductase
MRVAIIGSGQIAKIHVPIILEQPNTMIVGIADRDTSRVIDFAHKFKINHLYQEAATMIDEQKPDVVHVLVPPQHHAELSIMAMNKGCHVLVEKPMALTVDDAKKMISAANQNKVCLCVDHNMIFQDTIQSAMAMASKAVAGEVISVEASYLYDTRRYPAILEEGAEYSHWSYRLNGGPLQDQLPHPASLIMEYIPEIKEIQWICQNRGILPKAWPDELRVLIKSDIAIGFISISLSERPDTFSLVIKGTKGIIHADLFSNVLTFQKPSSLPRALARGLTGLDLSLQYLKGSIWNFLKFASGHMDKSNGIGPLIAEFYGTICKGGDTPVSLEKSLRVVDLMSRIWPEATGNLTQPSHSVQTIKRPRGTPTVLVTGASGFIGVYLVTKLLRENVRVRALVRPNSMHAGRLRKFDIDIVEADLADAEALFDASKGISTIYHLGMATSNKWEDHLQISVNATQYLLNAAIAHKVKRFVYVSTLAVYDLASTRRNATISENSPFETDRDRMGPHTWGKIQAEKLVMEAYRNSNLGATIVRPGLVIGPLGRVLFPHLGYHYQHKLFFVIGKGDAILPLTYVENTVDGIYRSSINRKAIGQTYNLVDDSNITVCNYIEHFIRTTGIQACIVFVPYLIPHLSATVYEILAYLHIVKSGRISRLQLRRKRIAVYFDNTKAKKDLGWEPLVSTADALIETFQWYSKRYLR